MTWISYLLSTKPLYILSCLDVSSPPNWRAQSTGVTNFIPFLDPAVLINYSHLQWISLWQESPHLHVYFISTTCRLYLQNISEVWILLHSFDTGHLTRIKLSVDAAVIEPCNASSYTHSTLKTSWDDQSWSIDLDWASENNSWSSQRKTYRGILRPESNGRDDTCNILETGNET